MDLFNTYIQPLTNWLFIHPQWALLITFLISFSESLAIIGSIVPGSVTMTAIGILAGSGVMRVDLTLYAAIFGAIMGDSASYTLGYIFSERLPTVWPFSRYPKWLNFGKDYFSRYGATSVLIGRFIGPMRSIIPVIAGMMGMNHWRFLIANVLSAIGWALLYIAPGILIGEASNELSAESATRLFMLILLLLALLWLLSLGIKWLFVYTNQYLTIKFDLLWRRLASCNKLSGFIRFLTPPGEQNHFVTAGLTFLFLFCFSLCCSVVIFSLYGVRHTSFDNTVFLFLQSLRTQTFDAFFTAIRLLITPLSLLWWAIAITTLALYRQHWRLLRYWLGLLLFAGFLILLFAFQNRLEKTHFISLPGLELTLATAFFGFLMVYLTAHYKSSFTFIIRIIILSLLATAGLGIIYLGDASTTTVLLAYLIGLTYCTGYKISYRRKNIQYLPSLHLPFFLILFFIVISGTMWFFYFKPTLNQHCSYPKQYVITDEVWWNQDRPLLPLYSTNRIGQRVGLLNIQYLGSIKNLQRALTEHGWKSQSDSFLDFLLLHTERKKLNSSNHLTTPFYLNKKPRLILTYRDKKNKLVLRFWRSNYHLQHHHSPLWLGSLHHANSNSHQPWKNDSLDMYSHFLNAVPSSHFETNQLRLPLQGRTSSITRQPHVLLIIRERTNKM